MRKFYLVILIVVLVFSMATPAVAGGDQVRGDNGQGTVNQNQVMDPPPFQDSPTFYSDAESGAIP
jgi:hypothetical protein